MKNRNARPLADEFEIEFATAGNFVEVGGEEEDDDGEFKEEDEEE